MSSAGEISSPLSLRWSGQTHRGNFRPQNEDAFLGLRFDAHEAHHLGKTGEASLERADFVFAVSDGMGGAMAGEFASRIAVEKITRVLPRSYKQAASGIEMGAAEVLDHLFDEIHKALLHIGESYAECAGMGATLTLCWFSPGWMHWGHAGDSRLYYLSGRDAGIRQLSHDDTHVGWLYRNAMINEWQARNHPRRTVLQKALGAGHQFADPQVGSVACEPGDQFLLCTDGLVESLCDERLLEFLGSASHAAARAVLPPAERLVEAALQGTSRDNITAVVVQVI